jgi:hypothetical protein
MVAVSFGSYVRSAVNESGTTATERFAVLLLLVMTGLNVVGSKAVARTQTVVVVSQEMVVVFEVDHFDLGLNTG